MYLAYEVTSENVFDDYKARNEIFTGDSNRRCTICGSIDYKTRNFEKVHFFDSFEFDLLIHELPTWKSLKSRFSSNKSVDIFFGSQKG